jgi:DNA-binding CsgD family transcriptional regulator
MGRRGRPPYPGVLTPREDEVVGLVAEGLSNAEVAARLGISDQGVKYHLNQVYSKLGLRSREELIAWRKAERGWRNRLALPVLGLPGALRLAGLLAALGAILAGAVLAIALLTGDETPPATPEPTPTESTPATGTPTPQASPTPELPQATIFREPRPTPVGGDPAALASAPLLVYADEVGYFESHERRPSLVEIVTYDLRAQRVVAAFRVGSPVEFAYPWAIQLAGRNLVINLERRVVVANLDGSSLRTIFTPPDGAYVTTAMASKDGTVAAIGVESREAPLGDDSFVAFVDVKTGAQVGVVTQAALAAGSIPGGPGVVGWWADGEAIEIWRITHKGAPAVTASVYRDGRVIRHAGRLMSLHTSGAMALYETPGSSLLSCDGYGVLPQTLDLKKMGADVSDAAISVPGMVVLPRAWTDDGKQVLLTLFPTLEMATQWGDTCFDGVAPAHAVWSAAGLAPVSDPDALLRSWAGPHLAEIDCEGQREFAPAPVSLRCPIEARTSHGELYIAGHYVDQVRSGVSIVGFID